MAAIQEPVKIWMRFEKIDQDGKARKLIIRNLPVSMTENCMEMFKEVALTETPMLPAVLRKTSDEKAHFYDFWKKIVIPQGNSIVCVEDNDEPIETKEIFGINFLYHVKKDDPSLPFPKDIPLMNLFKKLKEKVDVFEVCNCTEYMSAHGLLVKKKYRGMKLGQHLLEARIPLCKELGLKITANTFSTEGGQKTAARSNYRIIFDIKFTELSELANIEIDDKNGHLLIMAQDIK